MANHKDRFFPWEIDGLETKRGYMSIVYFIGQMKVSLFPKEHEFFSELHTWALSLAFAYRRRDNLFLCRVEYNYHPALARSIEFQGPALMGKAFELFQGFGKLSEQMSVQMSEE
jgi:hypothetical protein